MGTFFLGGGRGRESEPRTLPLDLPLLVICIFYVYTCFD